MPKVKLDKFNGIYTNIDENDLTLDKFQDSVNISHEDGYMIFNDYKVASSSVPTLPSGFSWETGIYTTLIEDPLSQDSTSDSYDVLVLVCKKVGTTIERRVALREDSTWYWLDQYEAEIDLSLTFLTTTIEGNAFFRADSGYLRLYLPHDCFWIGRLKREVWYPDTVSTIALTDFAGTWHIERLVDKFDKDNLKVKIDGMDQQGIVGSGATTIACADDRRLGILYEVTTIDTTGDTIVDRQEITINSTWLSEGFLFTLVVPFTLTEDDGGQTIAPPYQTGYRDNSLWWAYIPKNYAGTHYIIPEQYAAYFAPRNYSGWGDVATYGSWAVYEATPFPDASINGWLITKDNFKGLSAGPEVMFDYVSGGTLDEVGFSISKKKSDFIVTAILDERDEIIIDKRSHYATISTAITNYALKVSNIFLPTNLNKRVTKLKFYLKFIDVDADYSLYHEIDLLDPDESPYQPLYFYETANQGILLSQNISYLMDEDKPQDYKIIVDFRDLVTINGITLALKQDSHVYLYHSIVGNGVLQNNVILTANKLLIPETSNIIAVADLNNNAGIITDQKVFMCTIGESVGQLVFQIQDSIEHGINDPLDVIQTQNAIIMHTVSGIYKTNGYEVQLLSEPINDIVKASHDDYNIAYNPYKHLLYYITNSNIYYQFRFDYNKWEKVNITLDKDEITKILINPDGDAVYLFSDEIYENTSTGTSLSSGYVLTNSSDLGEISIDKLLNSIDLDYTGSCNIELYYDGILASTLTPSIVASRSLKHLFVPLISRYSFQKLAIKINFLTVSTRINKLELDINPLKRRFGAD